MTWRATTGSAVVVSSATTQSGRDAQVADTCHPSPMLSWRNAITHASGTGTLGGRQSASQVRKLWPQFQRSPSALVPSVRRQSAANAGVDRPRRLHAGYSVAGLLPLTRVHAGSSPFKICPSSGFVHLS
jgi:hypothetical protein